MTGRREVIDAQIHAWFADRDSWPEAGRAYAQTATVLSSAEREPPSPAELCAELDRVGVDRAILVPPVFAGDDNSAALQAAHELPDRFWVMGRIDLARALDRDGLAAWYADEALIGIRLTFFWRKHRALLDAGGADWLWPLAEELGIPIAVLAPSRLPALAEVAERHPGLRLIVDHFGMDLDLKDEAAYAAVDDLVPLARHENVAVKASTLPSYTTDSYPFPSLHEPIRRVVDAFGPERMFWGSELTRLPCPYDECLRLFTDALDFLGERDLDWILGRGIREWLDLKEDRP